MSVGKASFEDENILAVNGVAVVHVAAVAVVVHVAAAVAAVAIVGVELATKNIPCLHTGDEGDHVVERG